MQTKANRLFDEFNRRYWRGRLPKYRVIVRATLRDEALGLCFNSTRTIMLWRNQPPEQLRLTLLHEMCHIGLGLYDHGPRFLRRLQRLVRLGEAALVAEDIERYDGTALTGFLEAQRAAGHSVHEESFQDALRSELETMALDSQIARCRWARIARYVEATYELTPAQLRRAAPWAEREWRRLSADMRQRERSQRRLEILDEAAEREKGNSTETEV